MSDLSKLFSHPPPEAWEPQVGERVYLMFRGQVFEGVISLIPDEGGFVVISDVLLLPVACGRDAIRPVAKQE